MSDHNGKRNDAVPDPEHEYARRAGEALCGALAAGGGRYRAVLAALLAANIVFAFQQTAVIPAIPTIGRELGAPATWTAWLLSGYLVVSSVLTPLLGRLADRRGRKRLLVECLLVFFVGSVGAALSPNIGTLIAFRALQGVGGVVFPLSFSVARDEVPGERVGSAIGVLTGGFGVGTALGLGMGGFIAEAASWRIIFAAGGVAILAGVALVALLVPPSPITSVSGLDVPGGVLFGGSLGTLLLALTLGVRAGWGSWPVVVLFVATAVLLAGWVLRELRAESPLIDLRVFGRRTVLLTNLATLALGYLLFGTYFLVPHLVEAPVHPGGGYGFAAGAALSGLYLVPAAVGQLFGGPLSGVIEQRYSTRVGFVLGLILAGAGAGILAVWHAEPWQVVAGMAVAGLGVGFGIGTSGALVTRAVDERQTGVSNAFNSALRRVGGGIGSQVGAALLAAFAVAGTGFPSERAFVVGFTIAAALCIFGALLALFVPRDA